MSAPREEVNQNERIETAASREDAAHSASPCISSLHFQAPISSVLTLGFAMTCGKDLTFIESAAHKHTQDQVQYDVPPKSICSAQQGAVAVEGEAVLWRPKRAQSRWKPSAGSSGRSRAPASFPDRSSFDFVPPDRSAVVREPEVAAPIEAPSDQQVRSRILCYCHLY